MMSATRGSRAAARCTVLALVFMLGAFHAGRPLRGGDDRVGEEDASPQPANQFQSIALDQQISQMLTNGNGVGDESVQRKAMEQLEFEIGSLDEACGLSDVQRAKLTLAAGLEAARSVEAFEAFRRRYKGRVVDLQTREGQETWQQFHQEMNRIQRSTSRAGHLRHLPGRVFGTVLDDRQRDAWKAEASLRRDFHWRRCVDAGLEHLESFAGVTERQHEAIVALLMEDPPRIDMTRARETFGDVSPFFCWYALSRVDQDRLEAIFDARQWERVRNVVRQGEGWQATIDTMKLTEE